MEVIEKIFLTIIDRELVKVQSVDFDADIIKNYILWDMEYELLKDAIAKLIIPKE